MPRIAVRVWPPAGAAAGMVTSTSESEMNWVGSGAPSSSTTTALCTWGWPWSSGCWSTGESPLPLTFTMTAVPFGASPGATAVICPPPVGEPGLQAAARTTIEESESCRRARVMEFPCRK